VIYTFSANGVGEFLKQRKMFCLYRAHTFDDVVPYYWS